jgi:acyl-CoA synthetase (AMP-forming)/AMP-acid ligase II
MLLETIRATTERRKGHTAIAFPYNSASSPASIPKCLAYEEMWTAASRIAATLLVAAQGSIAADELGAAVVGVMVDEGPLLPLSELAILIAGMIILPMDKRDPLARLEHVLADANPAVVIVPSETELRKLAGCSACNACVFTAEELWSSSQTHQPVQQLPPVVDSTVSHVFFTSGSTGKPKGCINEMRALESYCHAKNAAHSVTEQSVVFVASAHLFDPSLADFFATWCAGGTIALAPRSCIFEALGPCLLKSNATHLQTTPSLFATIDEEEFGPTKLTALTTIALGGEPMPANVVRTWAPHTIVANTYGVTECCAYQSFRRCHALDDTSSGGSGLSLRQSLALIGEALEGNELLLVDDDGNTHTLKEGGGIGAKGEGVVARGRALVEQAAADVDEVRQWLVDFYSKHAPEKVANVDAFLARNQGKETELVGKVLNKYEGGQALEKGGKERLAKKAVEGELWIVGKQVGRGYLHRPKLTAAKFLSDDNGGGGDARRPTGIAPGDRCFRTGDVARLIRVEDGGSRRKKKMLLLLGRRDCQVKLNGQRMELREVEEVLLQHAPSLVQQVVCTLSSRDNNVVDEDGRGALVLVAWCVPHESLRPVPHADSSSRSSSSRSSSSSRTRWNWSGAGHGKAGGAVAEQQRQQQLRILSDALRLVAVQHLPPYMVPSRIVIVPGAENDKGEAAGSDERMYASLPTTSSGKLHRRQLAQWPLPPRGSVLSVAAGAPIDWHQEQQHEHALEQQQHPLAKLVAEIWAHELGISINSGISDNGAGTSLRWDDNFIELGGDSLAALRVCRSLTKRLQLMHSQLLNTPATATPSSDSTLSDATPPTADTPPAAPNAIAATAKVDEWGEGLGGGALRPAELIKRPVLSEFCTHLRAQLGSSIDAVTDGVAAAAAAAVNPVAAAASPAVSVVTAASPEDEAAGGIPEAGADAEIEGASDSSSLVGVAGGEGLPNVAGRDAGVLLMRAVAVAMLPVVEHLLRSGGAVGGGQADDSSSAGGGDVVVDLVRVAPHALHCACLQGHAAVAQVLIEHSQHQRQYREANELGSGGSGYGLEWTVSMADTHGRTALHCAAHRGPAELIEMLLVQGTNAVSYGAGGAGLLWARDNNEQTVLHHAARAGCPGKAFGVLLERWDQGGGDSNQEGVDCRDCWDRTPLHWAVVNGHSHTVNVLLSAGAAKAAVDGAGETPLQVAERRAQCSARERPDGERSTTWGGIAKILGSSGTTAAIKARAKQKQQQVEQEQQEEPTRVVGGKKSKQKQGKKR